MELKTTYCTKCMKIRRHRTIPKEGYYTEVCGTCGKRTLHFKSAEYESQRSYL